MAELCLDAETLQLRVVGAHFSGVHEGKSVSLARVEIRYGDSLGERDRSGRFQVATVGRWLARWEEGRYRFQRLSSPLPGARVGGQPRQRRSRWALGMVLLAVLTREYPFSEMNELLALQGSWSAI
jgi:hypothetical protein